MTQTTAPAASAPERDIGDLIRVIQPDTFSPAAHGAGHRLVVGPDDKVELHQPRLLARLFGSRASRQVFVKRWSVPKEVRTWTFSWSEGTSAVGLDFNAILVVQANEDAQAIGLAKALCAGHEAPGDALYGLINASLHRELDAMLARCHGTERTLSLLDAFRHSSTGFGESEDLNRAVTQAVARDLGGAHFRIGFQLKNLPPMQVELKCVDRFQLADCRQESEARTTALLRLDNYQAFRKSGLGEEARVRTHMERAIAEVVRELLFAQRYYDVVGSFAPDQVSVESRMRTKIEEQAAAIGYRVVMFQTFPTIAALALREPMRIDISEKEEKYALLHDTGHVRVALALSVELSDDFSKLHLLISPDESDVRAPIAERARQVCRDLIRACSYRQFNLEFDAAVGAPLRERLQTELLAYGLVAEVLQIVEKPTEETARFLRLCGSTIDFQARITPKADQGAGDIVTVIGNFEIVDLSRDDNSWTQFERRDYGFRSDSAVPEARMRHDAAQLGIPLADVMDRQSLALELERADIARLVRETLEAEMAMFDSLALHWRDIRNQHRIRDGVADMIARVVKARFGLVAQLGTFGRADTQTEQTRLDQSEARHLQLRKLASAEAADAVSHQQALRLQRHGHALELADRFAKLERQSLDEPDNPLQEQALERARREEQAQVGSLDRAGDTLSAALPPVPGRPADVRSLDWFSAAGEERPRLVGEGAKPALPGEAPKPAGDAAASAD